MCLSSRPRSIGGVHLRFTESAHTASPTTRQGAANKADSNDPSVSLSTFYHCEGARHFLLHVMYIHVDASTAAPATGVSFVESPLAISDAEPGIGITHLPLAKVSKCKIGARTIY